MITTTSAHSDPRMADVALRQRKAFKERIMKPNDENVARRYSWVTAEYWRRFHECEEEDRKAARAARDAA